MNSKTYVSIGFEMRLPCLKHQFSGKECKSLVLSMSVRSPLCGFALPIFDRCFLGACGLCFVQYSIGRRSLYCLCPALPKIALQFLADLTSTVLETLIKRAFVPLIEAHIVLHSVQRLDESPVAYLRVESAVANTLLVGLVL